MSSKIALFFLCLLAACAPSTWEDIKAQGDAEVKRLAALLRTVDTKEDLQKKLPQIKKSYQKLGDVILAIRALKEIPAIDDSEPSSAGEALFSELARLYEMPGCRDLIEEAQMETIQKIR